MDIGDGELVVDIKIAGHRYKQYGPGAKIAFSYGRTKHESQFCQTRGNYGTFGRIDDKDFAKAKVICIFVAGLLILKAKLANKVSKSAESCKKNMFPLIY